MGRAPAVTGISPKEGPPGTRVTIRGEFLGNKPTDLVGLTICGCDCLLSAEWKSANKIVARSGPGKGRGDIIVTTVTGGKGTCTVQFRGYHETIGPLKESAVWVEEAPPQPWASLASDPYHIDDPLGLSVEANEKKILEEDLAEIFPGGSGDLGSENFVPGWFLLEHHHATPFDDLRSGLAFLKRKIQSHKQGHLSFLKGNVGSVMEQLETLENLKTSFEKDVAKFGVERTEKIENAIRECVKEGGSLFEGVLVGREKAERRRNALGVLHRFKFLFTLPHAIDQNIAAGEYDAVISDYSRALNLFGKTDVNLFKKVLAEVEAKINDLKTLLRNKLHAMPNTLDNQKKIIRSLVGLGWEGDPGWEAIEVHSSFIISQLNECYSYHTSPPSLKTNNKSSTRHKRTPSGGGDEQAIRRVECVEELTQLLLQRVPDLWALGQSYFAGDLHINPDSNKRVDFQGLISGVLGEGVRLIRSVVLCGGPTLGPWLPHCLRLVRTLQSLHVPPQAQTSVHALVLDLRLECVRSALNTVLERVKALGDEEDWQLLHDTQHGTITRLPILFEGLLSECLNGLKESVLQGTSRESGLLESSQAKQEITALLQSVTNAFTQVLEELAGEDGEGSVAASQVSTYRHHSIPLMWETRVLSCIANWRWLEERWSSEGWGVEVGTRECGLVGSLIEAKADPLVGTIEPSMYIGHFDWTTDLSPTDVRPYAKEVIANVIAVHAQLEEVCPWLELKVISSIVETVGEEMYRLMSCVPKMSIEGAQQATLDTLALLHALDPYTTHNAHTFLMDALETIPQLKPSEKRLVDELLDKFKMRMSMQLACFANVVKQ